MRSAEREHYGLAISCAKRFQGRGVPMEELIGEAEAALLWAASRFDESRGVRFSTYAIPVVLGALRELCRRAQPMHVPRSEQRILAEAEKARQALCCEQGREPGVWEIAARIGVEAGRLGQMLGAQERMKRAEAEPDWSLAQGDGGFEDLVLCRQVISALPSPFGQVLWLRYGLGVSQAEVARKFGVGQPQVSRWEKAGKEKLRELLVED